MKNAQCVNTQLGIPLLFITACSDLIPLSWALSSTVSRRYTSGGDPKLFGPAFSPHQWDEHQAFVDGLDETIAVAADDGQPLLIRRTDRDDEASAVGELMLERFRHARRCRGDEDAVVRRVVHIPHAAVADEDAHVAITKRVKPLARRVGELGPAFNGDDLARQLRENRGLISRAVPTSSTRSRPCRRSASVIAATMYGCEIVCPSPIGSARSAYASLCVSCSTNS